MIESESRDRVAERIANVADSIRVADVQFGTTGSVSRVGMGHHVAGDRSRGGGGAGGRGGGGGGGGDAKDDSALAKAVRESAALAAQAFAHEAPGAGRAARERGRGLCRELEGGVAHEVAVRDLRE